MDILFAAIFVAGRLRGHKRQNRDTDGDSGAGDIHCLVGE